MSSARPLSLRAALVMAAIALAVTLSACSDDAESADAPVPNGPAVGEAPADPTCPPPNIAEVDPESLAVAAEPSAPLVSGQPAGFTITITNVTEGDVPLVFASSQQANVLLTQGETTVYDWGASRAFTPVLRCQTLAAGEAFTLELAETNPLDVPPGEYTLVARTVTAPYPPDFTMPVTVS